MQNAYTQPSNAVRLRTAVESLPVIAKKIPTVPSGSISAISETNMVKMPFISMCFHTLQKLFTQVID